MLDHALDYLAQGWSVVPCLPGAKHPCVKWKPYQDRLPTESEIRRWWRQWPNANIALITGKLSGVVVIDIDKEKGGSLDGQEISPLMSQTGDGYHIFHEHPGRRVQNSARDGVDVRGDGGIAILPPSRHKTGAQYTWLGIEGEPSPMPPWVWSRSANTEDSRDKNRKRDWIEDVLENGCPEGERNSTLARLAGYFSGKQVNVDICIATLSGWNNRLDSPLGDREVKTTIRSVYKTEKNKQAQATQTQIEQTSGIVAGPFDVTPYTQYMHKHANNGTRWLIEGWLPDQTIALMVAPPGSFKTWLEFDAAISIAGGYPFLDGIEPDRTGPVLLVQQEDFPGQITERLATIQAVREGIAKPKYYPGDKMFVVEFPGDLPIVVHEDAKLKFGDPVVMEAFHKVIDKFRPALTVIDPLYSAAGSDDFMASAVQDMLALKNMRKAYNTSFLIAHHTHKGSNSLNRERLWGSQFLNGWLETGWQIVKIEGEESLIVQRHTKVAGPQGHVLIKQHIDTGHDWKYAPIVQEITAEEVADILSAQSPKPGGKSGQHQRNSTDDKLDPIARRIRDALTKKPCQTSMELTTKLKMTPMDLETGLSTLRRHAYIASKGDVHALVIDAAQL